MSNSDKSYYESLSSSLDELKTLCLNLKSENVDLKEKVRLLEKQMATGITNNQESTSNLSEVDKIAIRNQISSYIKRIDQILGAE